MCSHRCLNALIILHSICMLSWSNLMVPHESVCFHRFTHYDLLTVIVPINLWMLVIVACSGAFWECIIHI